MKEYFEKYLKYKKKYMQLKNQLGGNPYEITNFHLSGTILAMAEAITKESLHSQMTQHGLGTGIYGFIDPTVQGGARL